MSKPDSILSRVFDLQGRVAIITGGGGLLGFEHATAISSFGGIPVLLDINVEGMINNSKRLQEAGVEALCFDVDITNLVALQGVCNSILKRCGHIDILVNNAARNPKVENNKGVDFSRLENLSWEQWQQDLDVGLGGAFNCAKVFGAQMAMAGRGVIVNIASDLGVIAPDQRLYRVEGLPLDEQPVKPVTYSVVKHGLVGLTKYLATYWCDRGVRCNALSPGGVYAGQSEVFVNKLKQLIPLGRMAQVEEYRGAVAFLCSDASSYMNGGNLIMDGGRSIW